MSQISLFEQYPIHLPLRSGGATVSARIAKSILTPATGFISAFDYSLNPYSGCQFGCAYCYAAFFVPNVRKADEWGRWVDVKVNALELLQKARNVRGKTIYVGSVTDPYQPIEAKTHLTRSLLQHMSRLQPQPRLVIQTRSPLITRDADVLRRFRHLRAGVSVTTDSESVRKRFEPSCPSIDQRLRTLKALKEAGIRTSACISPMLPILNPAGFADRLREVRADVYVTQPFKESRGPFAAGTRRMALELVKEFDWGPDKRRKTVDILRSRLPHLYEGSSGYRPE